MKSEKGLLMHGSLELHNMVVVKTQAFGRCACFCRELLDHEVFVILEFLQLVLQLVDELNGLDHNGDVTAHCIQSVLNLKHPTH